MSSDGEPGSMEEQSPRRDGDRDDGSPREKESQGDQILGSEILPTLQRLCIDHPQMPIDEIVVFAKKVFASGKKTPSPEKKTKVKGAVKDRLHQKGKTAAFARWSETEEKELLEEVKRGMTIAQIAASHKRTDGGIRERLKKVALGLLKSGKDKATVMRMTGLSQLTIDCLVT